MRLFLFIAALHLISCNDNSQLSKSELICKTDTIYLTDTLYLDTKELKKKVAMLKKKKPQPAEPVFAYNTDPAPKIVRTKTYSSSSSSSGSLICGATTKKGGSCSRRVKGGGRCWQH